MYRRIVVPLDGSDFSRTALPYALALAGAGTTVALVSAVDKQAMLSGAGIIGPGPGVGDGGLGATGPMSAATADLVDATRKGREKALRAAAGEVEGSAPATVEWLLLDGEPSDAVAAHVEESGAALVVMSTHGRGAIERAWLGSVADRLVRHLRVPVLLVRPTDAESAASASLAPAAIRRILVALDGSPLAEVALEPAARMARTLDAGLVLVRVTGPHLMVGSPYIPHAAQEHEEHFEGQRREARDYLETVAERLRADGVRVDSTEVRDGAPARTILELAHESAELIAMGTHGRGGFRRFILGSVSDKVLRAADLPVLLVRGEEEGEEG